MTSQFDVLIIPGSIRNKERNFRAIAAGYALKNNLTRNLILSGGKTKEVVESKSLLETISNKFSNIDKSKVFMEDESKDTVTNIIYSKLILEKHNWAKIGILTSKYHLKRCLMLARNYEVSITGITVEEILLEYDKTKLNEFKEYLKSNEMKSIENLEIFLNKLLKIDSKGKIPKLSSEIYYKFLN